MTITIQLLFLLLQVQLADKDNLGFVSRDILRVIYMEHFKKHGFGEELRAEELEAVLDDSIIDSDDQTEMFQWTARQKYRKQNPLGFIPVAIYDAKYISEVLVRACMRLYVYTVSVSVCLSLSLTHPQHIHTHTYTTYPGTKDGWARTRPIRG